MNTLVNGKSSKYVTVYPYDSTIDNSANDLDKSANANYQKNTRIYGDTIRETSTSSGMYSHTGWYNNYSIYPGLNEVFVIRGGCIWNFYEKGLFTFSHNGGWYQNEVGFRSVLVTK